MKPITTVRELVKLYPKLYDYNYKWRKTESPELEKDINEALADCGYRFKDEEQRNEGGEYNDIKGYYECEIEPLPGRFDTPDTATKEQATEPSTPVLEGKAEFMLVLNEGTEDETTISLAGYINLFDEDMDDDFIKVVNLKIGEKYQYGADEIKRIANK